MVHALPAVFGFPSAPTLGIVNFANETVISRLQVKALAFVCVFPRPVFI